MWRRVRDSLRGFLPTVVKASTPSSASSAASVPAAAKIPQVSSASEKKKLAAAKELSAAIRELSQGTGNSNSGFPYSSPSTLQQWDATPLGDLSTEELEQLARAHFEGVADVFSANPARAVEVWREAAAKGSIESKYSRAICLKDGVGTEKDTAGAFRDLKELADVENHIISQVSKISLAILFARCEFEASSHRSYWLRCLEKSRGSKRSDSCSSMNE
jgi:TPR repeat protein